jgi:polar amino acid transport system ATP-binding protein
MTHFASVKDFNSENEMPAIELRSVTKSYGAIQVLKGIDLSVKDGEIVALIGPSGSGKSTVVRCIHQLTDIDSGAIYFYGELLGYQKKANGQLLVMKESDIAKQRQKLGMVFQQFNLFPHMTVLSNVMEGPVQVLNRNPDVAKVEAQELLTKVGLQNKQDAYPRNLSGGQQQRVAIARALAMNPKALLLDEPTSALDPELVGEVLDVVRALADQGITMVIVTHEISFAREVADRVVFIEGGQIVEQGEAKATLMTPKTDRLRAFLSRTHGNV